jgi:NH3-dependent NAD+ synthetase
VKVVVVGLKGGSDSVVAMSEDVCSRELGMRLNGGTLPEVEVEEAMMAYHESILYGDTNISLDAQEMEFKKGNTLPI